MINCRIISLQIEESDLDSFKIIIPKEEKYMKLASLKIRN